MHHLGGLAGREGQRSGEGGIVGARGRRTVGGGVVHGHGTGRGLVERDDEHQLGGARIPLAHRDIAHRERGQRGRRIVVGDGAGCRAVGDGRAIGIGEADGQGLVALRHLVALDLHLDGLRRFTRREGEGAARGNIVAAGRGGAVGRRIGDRDRTGGRRGQDHGEGHELDAGVAFLHRHVGNRQAGHRRLGRVQGRVPFLDHARVLRADIVHAQFGERHAVERVGLVVAGDGDDDRAADLGDGEIVLLEPAEIEHVEGGVEGEDGIGAPCPVDGGHGCCAVTPCPSAATGLSAGGAAVRLGTVPARIVGDGAVIVEIVVPELLGEGECLGRLMGGDEGRIARRIVGPELLDVFEDGGAVFVGRGTAIVEKVQRAPRPAQMGGGEDAGEGERDGHALPVGVDIGALGPDQRVEAGALGLEPALDDVEVVAEGIEDDGFLDVGLERGEAVDAVLAGEVPGPLVAGIALIIAEVDEQRLAELIADEAQRIHGGVLHVMPGELAGLIGVPVGIAHPAPDLPFGDLSRDIAIVVDTRFERAQRV